MVDAALVHSWLGSIHALRGHWPGWRQLRHCARRSRLPGPTGILVGRNELLGTNVAEIRKTQVGAQQLDTVDKGSTLGTHVVAQVCKSMVNQPVAEVVRFINEVDPSA